MRPKSIHLSRRSWGALSAMLLACGTSSHPPASGDNGGAAPPSAGYEPVIGDAGLTDHLAPIDAPLGSSSAPGTDAAPVTCSATAAWGPAVTSTIAAGRLPAALGGPVLPGTYVLSERTFYPDDGEATTDPRASYVVRGGLVIDATTVDSVLRIEPRGGGSPVELRSKADYELVGTVLSAHERCPGQVVVNTRYSAADGELWLFPSAQVREVYILR
jgi:hypothetical protein